MACAMIHLKALNINATAPRFIETTEDSALLCGYTLEVTEKSYLSISLAAAPISNFFPNIFSSSSSAV
jgi:hypothetical protein